MPKINPDDIKRLGNLARIGIDDQLARELTPQLHEILDYVARLSAIDTTEVDITAQVTGLVDVWREDEVRATSIDRDALLANTPMVEDGYIKVKRVKQ